MNEELDTVNDTGGLFTWILFPRLGPGPPNVAVTKHSQQLTTHSITWQPLPSQETRLYYRHYLLDLFLSTCQILSVLPHVHI